MTVVSKDIKNKKTHNRYYILFAFLSIFFAYIIWLNDSPTEMIRTNEWTIQVAATEYPIMMENYTTLHVVAMDEKGEWIDGAEINVTFTQEEINPVGFYQIEEGLYEARTYFPFPGTWLGIINMEKDGTIFSEEIEVIVRGK